MRTAIILATLTVASPALADGAIVKSCDWSAAGSCPFNATKGADYLINLKLGTDCEATIQLVNPVGQVTKSMFAPDIPTTATVRREVPSSGPRTRGRSSSATCRRTGRRPAPAPPTPPSSPTAGPTPRRAARCSSAPVRSRTSARPTAIPTGSSSPTCVAAGCTPSPPPRWTATPASRWSTRAATPWPAGTPTPAAPGTVRFRPTANGTYFLDIPNGYHRTLSMNDRGRIIRPGLFPSRPRWPTRSAASPASARGGRPRTTAGPLAAHPARGPRRLTARRRGDGDPA